MERKRKLPPRAAARIEQAAKRRTSTPPADSSTTTRSATPATSTTGGDEGVSKKNAPSQNQLPKAVQAGKPLPTVDKAQPIDLPVFDYQTVQESAVLSESLIRSRQRWLNEGIFEKYWSKPSKRRGVAVDDPKNPPKDSMVKIGQATLIVEPHTFDVTFYGVKDPKPTPALPANRPILMYGPSRGMMPPPPPPTAPATPVSTRPELSRPPTPQFPTQSPIQMPTASTATPLQAPAGVVSTPQQPLPEPLQATPQPQRQVSEPVPAKGSAQPRAETPLQAPTAAATPTTPAQAALPIQSPSSVKAVPQTLPTIPVRPQASSTTPGQVVKEEQSQGPPPTRSAASPMGMETLLTAGVPPVGPAGPVGVRPPAPHLPITTDAPKTGPSPLTTPSPAMAPGRPPSASVPPTGSNPSTPARPPNGPSPSPPAREEGDSIVYVLAEKASFDPSLRDLMKRVASGSADKEDLDRFQKIIDQITAEKAKAAAAAVPSAHAALPTAHQLFVDGRTVHFFAEEVRIILDIVLRGNPLQRSYDLQPPAGSDPLIVELVKTALDDKRVRDLVFRIGENRALPTDPSDLKAILDACKKQVVQAQELRRQQNFAAAGVPVAGANDGTAVAARENTPASGFPASAATTDGSRALSMAPAGPGTGVLIAAGKDRGGHGPSSNHQGSQALRSKGPPPPPKLELSAVVVEFAGGTGDRYLFPRFSILEYTKSQQGEPEVVASFLLVRKGSVSEYGGDPDLDYYQPITVRIRVAAQSANQKVLDCLARVVAPADEVRRYMDNIMSTMTRAEYLLLAMRLPRREQRPQAEGGADAEGAEKRHHAPRGASGGNSYTVGQPQPIKGVLWTATAAAGSAAATPRQKAVQRIVEEDQQYQNFISGLLPKEVDS